MTHANKVIILTGATDGIGKESALHLANMGYTLGIHGRNKTKLELLKHELISQTGNPEIYTFQADFSELSQVREMGEQIKAKFPQIYCLINNAGTMEKERKTNSAGLEITLTVNHLSPFLLTQILLDCLKSSAHARIITVSSVAHRNGKIDFNDLQMEKSYSSYQAYANSKLANILFTFELSRRLQGTKVTANCLHPGVIDTKLLREGFPGTKGVSLSEGCDNTIYLATSEEVKNITGKYFVKRAPADVSPIAKDSDVCRRFWEVSEKLVKV